MARGPCVCHLGIVAVKVGRGISSKQRSSQGSGQGGLDVASNVFLVSGDLSG